MKALKFSRQRESIRECLKNRKDHPTADAVYVTISKEYPKISLGTVYRNLNLLADKGEVQRFFQRRRIGAFRLYYRSPLPLCVQGLRGDHRYASGSGL